jgi:hypothetical protein
MLVVKITFGDSIECLTIGLSQIIQKECRTCISSTLFLFLL